jgi:RNA polymerase sigma factor (TIGR02999 family)
MLRIRGGLPWERRRTGHGPTIARSFFARRIAATAADHGASTRNLPFFAGSVAFGSANPHSAFRMSESSRTLTKLLQAWRQGDQAAFDEVVPLIYAELRRIAASHLRTERPGHTFSPTDLISEAYLKLADGAALEFNDRAHFFAIASRNMRQILVDHARKRCSGKRGGGVRPLDLDETVIATAHPFELIALDEALEALAKLDARKARIVELHYFGGLTQDEIAAVCDVHVNTVARDLRFSEAWLRRELGAASKLAE